MKDEALYAKALAAVERYANRRANVDPHGEPEGKVSDPRTLKVSAGTEILVKDMMDILNRRYPGFRWALQPGEFAGMVNVFNLDFSGRWGYRIRMADVVNDPKRRVLITAGREILRRFGYPIDVFRPHLMAAIKRNKSGEAIPDVSDLKPDRFTEQARVEKAIAEGRGRVIGQNGGLDVVEIRGDV